MQGEASRRHEQLQRQALLHQEFTDKCREWEEYIGRVEGDLGEDGQPRVDREALAGQLQFLEVMWLLLESS